MINVLDTTMQPSLREDITFFIVIVLIKKNLHLEIILLPYSDMTFQFYKCQNTTYTRLKSLLK